jgi:hypothetical protein
MAGAFVSGDELKIARSDERGHDEAGRAIARVTRK